MIEMDTQQEWWRRNIFISFASRLSQSLFDSIILLIIQYHAQSSPRSIHKQREGERVSSHALPLFDRINFSALFDGRVFRHVFHGSLTSSRRTAHLVREYPSTSLTGVWTTRGRWTSFRRPRIIPDTCRVCVRLHSLYLYAKRRSEVWYSRQEDNYISIGNETCYPFD